MSEPHDSWSLCRPSLTEDTCERTNQRREEKPETNSWFGDEDMRPVKVFMQLRNRVRLRPAETLRRQIFPHRDGGGDLHHQHRTSDIMKVKETRNKEEKLFKSLRIRINGSMTKSINKQSMMDKT